MEMENTSTTTGFGVNTQQIPPHYLTVKSYSAEETIAWLDVATNTNQFSPSTPQMVGLDIEGKIALVQICIGNFVLLAMTKKAILALEEFFADPQYIFTGVGILQDKKLLEDATSLRIKNYFDSRLALDRERSRSLSSTGRVDHQPPPNACGLEKLGIWAGLGGKLGCPDLTIWDKLREKDRRETDYQYAAHDASLSFHIAKECCKIDLLNPTVYPQIAFLTILSEMISCGIRSDGLEGLPDEFYVAEREFANGQNCTVRQNQHSYEFTNSTRIDSQAKKYGFLRVNRIKNASSETDELLNVTLRLAAQVDVASSRRMPHDITSFLELLQKYGRYLVKNKAPRTGTIDILLNPVRTAGAITAAAFEETITEIDIGRQFLEMATKIGIANERLIEAHKSNHAFTGTAYLIAKGDLTVEDITSSSSVSPELFHAPDRWTTDFKGMHD